VRLAFCPCACCQQLHCQSDTGDGWRGVTRTQRPQGSRCQLRPPPQTPMAYHWNWQTTATEMFQAVAAAVAMADAPLV